MVTFAGKPSGIRNSADEQEEEDAFGAAVQPQPETPMALAEDLLRGMPGLEARNHADEPDQAGPSMDKIR